MTTPELTLTMLGTTSSGKTTFLLGMFDILSVGLHRYFMFTEDPDQGVDLQDAWDLLIDEGRLPQPTEIGGSKSYRFVFNHGTTPLVTIDWMDYRGGALDDRSDSAADVGELRERLNRSDSIYLVLDGENVALWLDDTSRLSTVQRKLKVQAMSARVLQAVQHRNQNGLPTPSLAVVITKADLLRGPGRSVGQALSRVVEEMPKLLPVVSIDGVTALICPVKVGNFGTGSTGTVAISDIDPVGLHRPMIFSLMHYLSEGLGAREAQIAEAVASRSEIEQQLVEMSQGFKAIFRRRRTAALQGVAATYAQTIENRQRILQADQSLIARLGQEVAGHPIVRDGKLEL
jgi:hypothetical protein